jgi:uncharacterized protein YjbI with pentapeptide repeats
MADKEHVALLRQGVWAWNKWRETFSVLRVDPGADLSSANLSKTRLEGANLSAENLSKADLMGANLHSANLRRADLTWANLSAAELTRADLGGANLSEANLSMANLSEADLTFANLGKADLSGANFSGANLSMVKLHKAASLIGVNFSGQSLSGKDFSKYNLCKANFSAADLRKADLSAANLSEATLEGADLHCANLSGADLSRAKLDRSLLIGTDLRGAILTGSSIYGIAAWDVALNAETKQRDLIITPPGEPAIMVDNINVAQFMYLLLNNEKIRELIDTITSKAVLILGRFSPERKIILDRLRDEPRIRHYVPILFDFEKPKSRDTVETIRTLAGMSKFIIADLTEAKAVIQELQAIVPNLPSVAVRFIIKKSEQEPGMFDHIRRFSWVVADALEYETPEEVIGSINNGILGPVEAKLMELR